MSDNESCTRSSSDSTSPLVSFSWGEQGERNVQFDYEAAFGQANAAYQQERKVEMT